MMAREKMQILVCGGTTCSDGQGEAVFENLNLEIEANALENDVHVVHSGCFGLCSMGPVVKIVPGNTIYTKVSPDDAREIVSEHILKGRKVERLLWKDPSGNTLVKEDEFAGQKKQLRIVLRNCGIIDPENIEDAIAHDAYAALGKVLAGMKPTDVIQVIKDSGLRGRGGGGFSTGLKWEIAYKNKADQKYVVCNADEGDPGAFMDRSVLEGDPHSVLEAMAICGYSIEAGKGLIYIRAEYPLAVARLRTAIAQAKEYGLLGKNIMGSGFDFDIEIRYGAGAFVCGEETALIHSMEGLRGEPTVKPPYPAESGFLGKPTNVNNVETLACISPIILKGASWFAGIGTERSKGTKVFALAGKINNVGLIEVPMGTTLREVIYEIGGGIRKGKKF
jgi:NADH:ubiquinone oxidoreductase subunit F (NADH-binding)/(2Fe-2S) ferredoxin